MKVVLLRGDLGARSLYRIEQPARCVNEAGLGVECEVVKSIDVDAVELENGSRRVESVDVEADVVVLQNPVDHVWCQVIEHLQAKRIRVVVDVDDDYNAIPVRNIAYRGMDPALSPWSNRNWLARACATADLVTTTTSALAYRCAWATGHKAAVLPNYIACEITKLQSQSEWDGPLRVGWTGTVQTHPHDLQSAGRGVAQAVRDGGAVLRVVGDARGVRKALGLTAGTDLRDTGWLPMRKYRSTSA